MSQHTHVIDGIICAIDEAINRISAFEDAKKRSDYILDMVDEAVITTDEEGTILSVNSFFESRFGYNHDNIIGKKIDFLFPEEFRKEISLLISYPREGIFFNKENIAIHDASENSYDCEISICRMLRGDGAIRYIFILK